MSHQGSFLPPKGDYVQPGDAPRRTRLVAAPTSLRFHEAQVNALTELHEEYPMQFRTFSDVVRTVISDGIPVTRNKLRAEGDRLAVLNAATGVDRSRIHRDLINETIAKLVVEVKAALGIGTPEFLAYTQQLIVQQRAQFERLPVGDPWRIEAVRRLTEEVQPLLARPPRKLHLIRDQYSDPEEVAKLE